MANALQGGMKKILVLLLLMLLGVACKQEPQAVIIPKNLIKTFSPEMAENAVMYQVHIRNYSPEGTFNAFTQDIPKLKKLGVKIIYLMPVQEIGLENRKAGRKLLAAQLKDSVLQTKIMGNPYALKDYRSIQASYGSADDLKKLIATAHQHQMYVIMDWVANHTAWDHVWVKKHPDFYVKGKEGLMQSPYDWRDVVQLNYTKPAVHYAMIEEMRYWLKNYHLDGFRCQVAGEVPTQFWERAQAELQKVRPIFMLAEAEKPSLLKKAFDAQYAWEGHYILNNIAQGKMSVKELDTYLQNLQAAHLPKSIFLNFISTSEENSWNGSEYERMGDAVEVMTALTYMINGMPLIYNGQEYDMDKRLRPYQKDTVPHTLGNMWGVYEKLGQLKTTHPALHSGQNASTYTRIKTSDDTHIIAFERVKKGKKLLFVANLSKEEKIVALNKKGAYRDYMTGEVIQINDNQSLNLKSWAYKILVNQ